MSSGDLHSTSSDPSACSHNQNPEGEPAKTSATFSPFSLLQFTVEFSVNNFSLAFSFVLLCTVFIAYSVWDLFVHHRSLQSRSLSD